MPMAVEFYDLSTYDLVISDSSSFAKGVITSSHTLHICYCHTPTRYLWSDTHSYINELKYNKIFKKIISLVLNYIRMWDRLAADRVDVYIANSQFVGKRISKYYKRDFKVIYPPVETDKFTISDKPKDYFLIGGRLASYKRTDIVVEAFNELGFKLKIFGDGVDLNRLKKIARRNPNIEFLGRVSDEEKSVLYSGCQAFIYPQEEDFGITAVVAMASGRPVIAYASGGALETVIPGLTGRLFKLQDKESIIEAVKSFSVDKYDSAEIKKFAEQFSVSNFKNNIQRFIDIKWQEFNEGEIKRK
jgi:glycosyltransferase involved in cell wall biosynthesis